jgi:flagellar brake protein
MLSDTRTVEQGDAPAQQEWDEFRITHMREQMRMFERVRDLGVPIVLKAADDSSLTTKLCEVDSQASPPLLRFAVDARAPVTASLLAGHEASAVTYLESIKLQFDLHSFKLLRGPDSEHGSLLQSQLPRAMYRFQRRNAFRVRSTSRTEPVAKFRHPSLPDMQLSLHVMDLSIGGCALWLPHDVPGLQSGTELGQLLVQLDNASEFSCAVRLQHLGEMQGQELPTSAGKGRRMGCAWQALSGSAERILQRWIDREQQRMRLLKLD